MSIEEVTLAVSDESQIAPLQEWLSRSLGSDPGQGVARRAVDPSEGELGAVDVLVVLASSTGLVAAINVLPEFFRSRRAGVRIETTVRGRPFVIDASNVDDVLPIVKLLLDE